MLLPTENHLKWFVLVFALVLCPALAQPVWAQTPQPTSSASQQNLQEEKLRQETIKLQLENQNLRSPWNLLLSYSTLITALVAVGGLVATFLKQISENGRQRDLDRQQQESN